MARTKSKDSNASTATIGFEATAIPDFGPEHADTFRRDLRRDMNHESVDWTQPYFCNRIGKLTNMKSK